jgi:hypothetical protein
MDLFDIIDESIEKKKEELVLLEQEKKNKPTLFNYINQILYKTDKFPYDKKVAPAYILSVGLSHNKELLDIVNKINCLQFHLKDDIIYKYYKGAVPKGKRYIKWIKKSKEKDSFKKKIEALMEEGYSKREAIIIQKQKERMGL